MRKLDLRLSIALAVLVPLPGFAQVPVAPIDPPKVIFCSGQCFAVDERGVRTPVNKGTLLREGQRLETGPGAYAQLKVGQAAELAVSERGQVRFDQKSVGGRDLVILDQGRIRMVAGEAMGKLATRALELRTADGTFALKGADVEVKKLGSFVAGSNLTYMKVNNGNASLHTGQTNVSIPKDAVHGVTGGKVITDRTFSLNEVALPPAHGTKPAIGPGSTLRIAPPVAGLPDRAPLPQLVTVGGPVAMPPVMSTMQATTGTCLSCTTLTLSPTVSSVSPTTTLSSPTTTTSTSTIFVNTQLTTASTCLSCSTLTTTSPTTTTTTTTTSTLLTTSSTTFKLTSTTFLLK